MHPAEQPPTWPRTPRDGIWAACGLALAMATVNGFARFAYALILPPMRADLAMSYTQAGSLNTINAIGYLIGSLVAFRSIRRLGPKMPFIVGLWLTSATVIATGLTRDFASLGVLRGLTGVTAAYVFITGGVLAASIFPNDPRRAATAIAIYFGGGGVGLLISSLTLPWLFAVGGDGAWPRAWLLLGVLSAVASVLASWGAMPIVAPEAVRRKQPWSVRPLLASFAAYGCFALGYFAYMTFIVAWMREFGAGALEIAVVWAMLGIGTLVSPRIWSGPMANWRGGRPLAGVMTIIGIGAALPLLGGTFGVMVVSAVLFGGFFMTPAAITALVKQKLPSPVWGEAVAAYTVFFSLLQCVGPVATGYLADATGSLAAGLAASAAILLLGAMIALAQR